MSTIGRIWSWGIDLVAATLPTLLPPTCSMCGFPGAGAELDLCTHCLELLPAEDAAPGIEALGFTRVVVPFRYDYPVDHMIRALKFRGERRHARVLGALLADELHRQGGVLPQALVPVPLHSSRYRHRGFNQSEEIARFAARKLEVPVHATCLIRKTATAEQSGLPLRERQLNVRGAFELDRPLRCTRIALVDDVLTTGNTAREAAKPLLRAGIADIELWAVARVVLQ